MKINSCGKFKCFFIQKTFDKKERMAEIENQLDKCNECVSITTDHFKEKTRNIVANKYITEYWERVRTGDYSHIGNKF